MKREKNRKSVTPKISLLAPMVALGVLVLASLPSHGAPPPTGKTYFMVLVGMEEPFSFHADCVKFTKAEMCFSDGTCGSWTLTETEGQETAFTFEMEYDEEDTFVAIEGRARIENRGKKDTLGAVGRVRAEGGSFNYALTGRSTSRGKCKRLLRQWGPADAAVVE